MSSNHMQAAGLVVIAPMLLLLLLLLLAHSCGKEYSVGALFWSIPITNDFYTNWSSSQFFHIGDTLYFDFDSGHYNVMQVSIREYEGCTAEHPFVALWDGPAGIMLMEEGVFYFICSIANYCALGQKFSVVVHRENENNNSSVSAPNSSPTPSSSSPNSVPAADFY